jgi:hypothetical protein
MSEISIDVFLEKEQNKDGFLYRYIMKYYPKKYNVSEAFCNCRDVIYHFKDGGYEDVMNFGILKNEFISNYLSFDSSWWLSVIPASSIINNTERNKEFVKDFSSELGIHNGFELITPITDRDSIHESVDNRCIDRLSNLGFGEVRGKKILLFDDVYTTGKSFVSIARELKRRGALNVYGLFLGKTHWLENELYSDQDSKFEDLPF